MTADPRSERLRDDGQLVLQLRLLVGRQGHVVQGEVGSIEAGQDARHWQCFYGSAGLLGAVQACVAAAREGKPTATTSSTGRAPLRATRLVRRPDGQVPGRPAPCQAVSRPDRGW